MRSARSTVSKGHAPTSLHPRAPLTAAQAAEAIASGFDDATRLRVFFEFSRGADEAGAAASVDHRGAAPDWRPPLRCAAQGSQKHIATRHRLPGRCGRSRSSVSCTGPGGCRHCPPRGCRPYCGLPHRFAAAGIYLDRHDLSENTIDSYIRGARYYLEWCDEQGHAAPLTKPVLTQRVTHIARRSGGHHCAETPTRPSGGSRRGWPAHGRRKMRMTPLFA